ncbi:septal ring lytic transglycosylase RlpA family protein [bacterium]|nr:septal ring lytic transglycosylase RlpA family protein [bacterium]QQR56585.1 MAG: septal ring lytic transglycosylase RlpA family protein [Candidatus Melainabacteria bacterium]
MNKKSGITFLLAFVLGSSLCASQTVFAADDKGDDDKPQSKGGGKSFSGKASWYGPGFNGKKTASGEIFDMNKCSAAHLKLPFQTKVQIEDPRTGKTVIVKVNDRGPYVKTRVLDMSKGAAVKLGTISRGVAFIDCLVLDDK